MRPSDEIETCLASHRHLERSLASLIDRQMREPSLLPGWTRGHVLTHLADKTATHVWLIGGAEVNEVRDQYPAGFAQAQSAVDARSGRSAAELREDVAQSFADLESAWERLDSDQWQRTGICVPGPRSMADIVSRHLRDVEAHHVDLDIGYSPSDWPELFVEGELAKRLAGLSDRAGHSALLAWLLGRGDAPTLGPW